MALPIPELAPVISAFSPGPSSVSSVVRLSRSGQIEACRVLEGVQRLAHSCSLRAFGHVDQLAVDGSAIVVHGDDILGQPGKIRARAGNRASRYRCRPASRFGAPFLLDDVIEMHGAKVDAEASYGGNVWHARMHLRRRE